MRYMYSLYWHSESHLGFGLSQVDEIYTANTMPADALVTLGTRASAGMVLILKAGKYSVSNIRRINIGCTITSDNLIT